MGILKVVKPNEEYPMTTEDIILHIFYLVATSLPAIPKHSQAKLYPSELVTIGILFALKGGHFRAFYRWLVRDYGDWLNGKPRSAQQNWQKRLGAAQKLSMPYDEALAYREIGRHTTGSERDFNLACATEIFSRV